MFNVSHFKSFFNNKISLSFDGGNISSDSGLILVKEFLSKIKFNELLQEVSFVDDRKFFKHDNSKILTELIFMIIAGYDSDSNADLLSKDPIFTSILDNGMASQPSIARFFDRCNEDTVNSLKDLNYRLIEMYYSKKKDVDLIIDLDSTHFDTYGKQEESSYNTHYGTTGYHPLVAYDSLSNLQYFSHLRPGSDYTSTNVEIYVEELINHLSKTVRIDSLMFRGDSGFATPKAYEIFEKYDANYVIRLKWNAKLRELVDTLDVELERDDYTKSHVVYSESMYQANSWSTPRRIVIKSVAKPSELVYEHHVLVTNFSEGVTPKEVFKIYEKRGSMENLIKESKNGFNFGKTDSHEFIKNEVRMMISVLAYNIIGLMKLMVFPEEERTKTMVTIRNSIIKIGAKIITHGRRIYVKMSSYCVYRLLYEKIHENIGLL